MLQHLTADSRGVRGTRELGEQDRRLGAVVHAAELGAILGAQGDLGGAEGVDAGDRPVAEAHADGRLLRLAQRPVGQPLGDALPGGAGHGREGLDRLAEIRQLRDDVLVEPDVGAGLVQHVP